MAASHAMHSALPGVGVKEVLQTGHTRLLDVGMVDCGTADGASAPGGAACGGGWARGTSCHG